MHTLKAKMTKLLYFPSPWSPLQTLNTQQTPQPEVDPVVKDVQESLAIYLRKTVEKQDVASNVKVNSNIYYIDEPEPKARCNFSGNEKHEFSMQYATVHCV